MPKHPFSFFVELLQDLRLAWRLLWEQRMPLWTKLVPLGAAIYLLWPVDIIIDPILGLGQLDDLAFILLAAKLFIALAPGKLVTELNGGVPRQQPVMVRADEDVLEGKTHLLAADSLDK